MRAIRDALGDLGTAPRPGGARGSPSRRAGGARRTSQALALLAGALIGAGCAGQIRTSTSARAMEEQLLVSSAAERAVAPLDLRALAGHRVLVDTAAVVAPERAYLESALLDALVDAGARAARTLDEADVVLEARTGSLAGYHGHWRAGLPVGGISLSASDFRGAEIVNALSLSYDLQEGWARLRVFAYEVRTGRLLLTGAAWGYAHKGYLEDIYPERPLLDTLVKERVE